MELEVEELQSESDDNMLDQTALNTDDDGSAENLKARKTISNPTRTIEEFNEHVQTVRYETMIHPVTGESYQVPVYVLEPQPNPKDKTCNPDTNGN